jgi:hypothetical protein
VKISSVSYPRVVMEKRVLLRIFIESTFGVRQRILRCGHEQRERTILYRLREDLEVRHTKVYPAGATKSCATTR